MKKIILPLLLVLFTLLIFSCNKEELNPEYPFTVTVLTYEDSVRAPNILVTITAPVDGSAVYFEGFTDENGQVSFKYDKDAILLIRAIRGNPTAPSFIGCNEIRLQPNETVSQKVYLQPYNPEIPGC